MTESEMGTKGNNFAFTEQNLQGSSPFCSISA